MSDAPDQADGATATPAAWAQRTISPIDSFSQRSPAFGWEGRLSTATDDWSRCVQRDPDHRERAIRSCGRVIGERISRTNSAAAYFYRGQLYEDSSQPERAIQEYERALELFSAIILSERRNPYAYANRALLYYRTNRYNEALADNAAAIAIASEQAVGPEDVGDANSHQHASDADRRLAYAHDQRGVIYFRMAEYENATLAYDRAAQLSPEDAYYQSRRCEVRAARGIDLETAAAACEDALRLSEDGAYGLFARGFLHFMGGDLQSAWTDFNASVEADDQNAYALYGRGVAASRLGRAAEGEADIARALQVNPRDVSFYADAGLRP